MKKQLLLHSKKTLFREFSFRMAFFAVLTFLTAQSSLAQSTYTWGGTTGATISTDFLTGSNWGLTTGTGTATPTFTLTNNSFTIPSTNVTNFPVLSTDGTITAISCAAITLNQSGATLTTNIPVTCSAVMNMTSGAILTTNANYTISSSSTSSLNGTLNVNAGIFNVPKFYIGDSSTGGGIVNVANGATLTGNNVWKVSNTDGNAANPGMININGGTLDLTGSGSLTMGVASATTTRKGILNLNSGVAKIASGGSLTLIAQTAGTATGIINVYGGEFQFNPVNFNNSGLISITGGSFKILSTTATINATTTSLFGKINIDGGTLDASGSLTIGSNTTGMVTVNVNSGTMNVAGALSVLSTATVNIGSGSIVLTGDQTTAINALVLAGRIAAPGRQQVVVNYNGTNTIVTATAAPVWDGTSWSNGTPSATLEAIIDGNYSTTSNGTFNAYKLTVNSGKTMTVNSGTYVTVQNQVINNGSLVVENNANLIQVNNVTNTGAITVKRNSNALSRLDYTLWSSPVASQNLATFSPLTSQSPSRFYTYDGTNNVYAAVATPTATTFAAGNGYLIRMPNTAVAYPTTETFAGVFTGVPNNGNVNRTSLTAGKFYAVGNPYPSTISAASFFTVNTATTGTLYFWRKTNGIANSGSSYATYTSGVGGTAAGNVAPNDIVPNGSIQVGQGFVVNTGTATSLTFTNAMREAAPTSAQFLKVAKSDEKSRIWLNLTASGLFSQALIGYVDGATEGVDNGFDGEYINDSKVALTSNIDGGEYAIQGRPAFDASDVVALNFKTDKAGDYTIAIDHTDGVFAKGQAVYLVDSVSGKETDLTKEAYTFTAESGTANNRFTLKYQSSSKTVGSPVFNENTVTVYKNNGTLYVNSAASTIVTIKVFNLQGRLIGEQKDVNATTAAIKNLRATQQVLLVQVTSEDGKVVTKKVVN